MRLFVALDLPWELKQRLALLSGGIPGARWVGTENFHLTLRFMGEVHPIQAEEIDHTLAAIRAPAFDLSLAGVGVFGKGDAKGERAAALWAGVDRNPALDHLQTKIETALRRARGVKSHAARLLGISRPTLDKKIADLRIDIWV